MADESVEADSTSHTGTDSPDAATKKPKKTYEKRKADPDITSSPSSASAISSPATPRNNTSRYGRTRKPKITEDFYNTEDIFGPYERIPCSPVRGFNNKNKKTPTTSTRLELSPNKSNEVVTLDEKIIKPNLDDDGVLTIDIPAEETLEVSKIIKIVSSNVESPKSPGFAKPVKTYSAKRDRSNNESSYHESFGLPDYQTPFNGLSHSESSESSAVSDNDSDDDKLHIDESGVKSEHIKRTKFNLLSLKKNSKSPTKPNLIQSDNISTSTPAITTTTSLKSDKIMKHLSKRKLKKVHKMLRNKFRVRKKPVPISGRLKVKKVKAKVRAQQKIHLGVKKLSGDKEREQVEESHNHNQTDKMDKKKYEKIDDLQKMYMPEVGDLTWSRVGTFPFWPSIVSKEPNSDRHTKTINLGKRITTLYHVNFFGDNGRRSWVFHTHIFPFHQRSDLEIMAKSVSKDAKPKEPRHLSAYIINPTKLIKWETAVTEAETLSEYPKDKRIQKFFEMVKSPKKKKKKTKKKLDEEFVIKKEQLKEEDYETRSRRKTTKKRKASIVSDDSYTESEKCEPLVKAAELRDTPSPVLSSSVRVKTVNLFKGITRDRVCQICGKFKDVYRCKGRCNGQYHIECDRKQRARLPAIAYEKTDFELLIGENIVTREESSADIASNMVESILTNVFDKVLVESLTISEQIDLKMQEVMKNVTNYQDSQTDDSSSSETESKTNSQNSEISESQIGETFDEIELNGKQTKLMQKVIKHVTADGVFDIIQEVEVPEEIVEVEIEDHSNFKCTYCSTGYKPPCFICNKDKTKSGDGIRHKCMTTQCGKYYHAECLKDWPQTKWHFATKRKEIDNENLSCPYHNCHTCISDDPRGPLSRMGHEKLAKCIRCPTTYHTKSHCIPAGTEILSNYQIICPKHLISTCNEQSEQTNDNNKKATIKKIMPHVNAAWCFICSMGGSLICCETCPSSFHVECLKMTPPEGKYICEECESGRLPLYDEIVWVKLGSYRWWPAQILFPVEIPDNVKNIAHNQGEFVVRFFGSHDHYWVNRGRVFLFQEGDTGHASSKKSAADRLFVKAIEEASKAHQMFIDERANIMADSKNSMRPPSYIKIKVNKPVGDVRITDADTSNTTPCDCDPNWDHPCGPDSDCLNRILLTECNPAVCAAGNRCGNQSIQNRDYAHVEPFKTSARGWGLRTLSPIKQGTFVIEYVGEVINETEYIRRMKRKHEQKDENYYFLTIDKDRMIDAGPKGNVARFMNHSCSPNCETQKWTVNGDTKVGLFAIKDIPEGAELTFNYNLECIGEEKKECRCGAPNCSGFIGVKAKQDELIKKKKGKKMKINKKKIPRPITKDFEVIACFICGKTNAIQQCDRDACNKFYHLECVQLKTLQEGKWFCPWHSCNVCTKRTTRCCYMCTNSYCPLHSEGFIRYDRVKGFVCKEHDTPELANPTKKKTKSIAEQDLEEILKNDPSTTPKNKSHKKNTETPLKVKKIVNERSLLNLKQYSKKLNLRKSTENKEEKPNSPEPTLAEIAKIAKIAKTSKTSKIEKPNSPEPTLAEIAKTSKIEKPNGLHPESKEPVNKNNNLTIKKRKSRLSKDDEVEEDDEEDLPLSKRIKIDDEVDDDVPLSKRIKDEIDDDVPLSKRIKIDNEVQSITKKMDISISRKLLRSQSVPLKIPEVLKQKNKTSDKNNKLSDVNKKQQEKLTRISELVKQAKEKLNKPPEKAEAAKQSTEKSNKTSEVAKKQTEKVTKTSEVAKKQTSDVAKQTKEKLNKSLGTEKNNKSSEVAKQTKEKLNKSIEVAKQPTEKINKSSEVAPEDLNSSFEETKQLKEKLNKSSEVTKHANNNTDILLVVKRPRGRPRKYFRISEKETESAEKDNSSLDSSQSQSSEYDSDDDDDDDYSLSELSETSGQFQPEIAVDLEMDAEEEIQKSVINKETLSVVSVNANKTKNQIKATTKIVSSPRPGLRKSLRISEPFDTTSTTSNLSNSEMEISIDLNSSQELEEYFGQPTINSTLLEEKRRIGRPKSQIQKKEPLRKSSRFTGIDLTKEELEKPKEKAKKTNEESEGKKEKVKKTNEESEGKKVKKTNEELEGTKSDEDEEEEESMDMSTDSIEEPQKRKRGRPRKYFDIAPTTGPKRPKGRPKKIKFPEEEEDETSSSSSSPLKPPLLPPPPTKQKQKQKEKLEEPTTTTTTEKYKIKLNTSTTSSSSSSTSFESHINEIKLTTNVPERHLRVMLRKADMETKVENKFLKMQNDIERDLPIRKRSKLRYETHL